MTKQDFYDLYATDPSFVADYHGNLGWTAEQCAEDTCQNLKGLELYKSDFGYIAVKRDDLIERLAGFFIKPDFRNSATKQRFFAIVDELLPRTHIAYIHSGNVKGIKFLASRGQITMSDNITTCIVFRREI